MLASKQAAATVASINQTTERRACGTTKFHKPVKTNKKNIPFIGFPARANEGFSFYG
jgi:hypothetical protein